jgi:hypothetical protein
MIDKELKKRWVEALRSGDYLQTDSVLRFSDDSGDTYCCLGVLCNLINPNAWVDEEGGWHWNQQQEVLPEHYHKDLGLAHTFQTYTHMNDDQGLSFTAIADFIEANE